MFRFRNILRFLVSSALLLFLGVSAYGNVTVTPASGGTNLSADKAANATLPAWTTLGNIVIAEVANDDLAASQTNVTLILTAPTGWQFNTGVGTVAYTASRDITAASIAVTGTTITVTFSTDGTGNKADQITISGIQIQATSGATLPASGQIYRNSGSAGTASIAGITATASADGSGGTNFGSVSQIAGAANKLAIITQPSASASAGVNFATQPVIEIQDQFGSRLSSANGNADNTTVVTAARSAGSGTLQGTLTSTSTNGRATFLDLRHNVATTISVLFSSGSLTSITSGSIVVSAGSASKLTFVQQPSTTTAGQTISPAVTVKLQDAFDNDLTTTGTSISIALLSGTGTLNGTLSRSTTSGVATFNDLSNNTSGTKSLEATSAGLTSATSSSFTINASSATKVVYVQQPTNASAGATISPAVTVQLRDVYDNDVLSSGVNVSVALTSGTGTLSGTTTQATDVSGLATFNDLSINLVGSKQLTATSASLTSAVSNAFTISAASAAQLAFMQQPTNANAGAPISPSITVQLKDAFGNNVAQSGVSIAMAISSGSGTLSGTTTRTTDVNGLATFDDLSINLSGSKNFTASSGALTSAVSSSFTIAPGGASQLVFKQQPTDAAPGVTITPSMTVAVRDIFGNPVSTAASVTMTLSSGTGTLSGTTTRATVDSIATFDDLSIDVTGAKQLTASSTGLASAVSSTFSINPAGTPTKVAFVQQPTTTTAGQTISPSVTVQLKDEFNANVASSGVTITLALTSGTGTLSGTLSRVTSSGGLATFNDLSINLAGSKQITATSSGLTSDVSTSFTINAASVSQLVFIQQPSNVAAGSAISPSITAQLADQYGNGITTSGVNVTMSLSSGTGTLSGTLTQATVSGVATFNDLSINVAGSKQLTAASSGLTSAVSNSFTVSAGTFTKLQLLVPGETASPGSPSGKTGTPSSRTAGTAFTVTVNAVDANWNIVSSVTDVVGITSSDANASLPANAAFVSGTKTLSVTLKTAGSKTLTATDISDGSKTANTSPSITVNAGAFTKLQLLVPGETADPGSATGKTGSPSAQTAGTAFNITVNAVDANWNLVNTVTDVVNIASTDVNATLPSDGLLIAGTKTFSVTFKTAGSATLTASDVSDGAKTLNTSPAITVSAGAFAKLQLLVPGETAAPGSATGKTGTPTAQTFSVQFSVTVNAVDANWNLVSSTDVVGITSSDPAATLPANAAMVAGTQSFNVTFGTSGGQTLTATDITNGARSPNTSPTITVNAAGTGTVTPATGASAVSADNVGGTWTALTGPIYTESTSGNAGAGTIILNAPTGFEFDIGGTAPTVLITRVGGTGASSRNINGVASGTSAAVGSVTASQITFSVTSASASGVTCSLTWQNVRIRPTAGTPLASGNITKTGTSTMTGVTNSVTNFGTLTEVAGAVANIIVTLPGQTFTSGSGNSGTPTAQTAGQSFAITKLTATDQFLNTATSYGGNKTISYSGPTGDVSFTTSVNFSNGQSTTSLTTILKKAQTTTLTASDGTTTGQASSNLTVNPDVFTKLQILVPGESAAAGTATGKTGSPSTQTVGTSLTVTVNAVDANWNTVTSATDVVGITSSDGNATLPSDATLVSGTKTFSVTFNSSGSQTITASDITQPSKTSNTSPSVTVNAGAFTKLQILLPGESAAPGTPTGKTGTPTSQAAGTLFIVTVNAVDASWNVITSVTDVVSITSTDANATMPADAALVSGTKTFSITLKTAGSATLTASDITQPSKSSNTSPSVTVNAGVFTKLQVLMPGESAAPGSASGKTGTPDAQTAGAGFTFTVRAVDANWNLVNTVTDVAGITSSDGAATLPANAALVAGVQTFSLTFNTAGSQTATATDVSDGTKSANTGSSVTVSPAGTGTVTPATGGTAISADTYGGTYTSLTGPTYNESTSGNATTGTIVLKVPTGFEFDTAGTAPTVLIQRLAGSGPDADNINGVASGTSAAITSMTSSTVTFTISSASTNGAKNSLTWQDIRVRPTAGTPLASGNITKDASSTSTMTGVVDGTTNFGTLTQVAGAVSKLIVTLPGETFTAGSGNSGSVTAQTAGVSFNLTKITATDQFLNIVTSYSGAKTISYSGPTGDATYTTSVSFTSGQSTTTLATVLNKAQTATLTADDGTTSGPVSSSLTVNPGTVTKLQVLVPGETAAPGTATGKTGTPSVQSIENAFTVTVNAVDANWNLVTSATNTVHFASSDGGATLPSDLALVSGTRTYTNGVQFSASGTQTITVTDISPGTLTSDTSPSITVTAGAFSKLQLLLPGETAAPGTPSGKTGTPDAQTAGTAFTVTVNAVDNNWNVVNVITDVVGITSSDANATLPSNAALVSGTETFSVTLKTAGTATITATDITDGGKSPDTSPSVTVNPGTFTKLQLLVPGETSVPGTASGKTGTPTTQTEGAAFTVTVNAVDANWNLVNSVTDVVHFTSSDVAATLPADAALVAGTQTFSVTYNTAGTATLTASDVTQPSKSSDTSPSTTVNAAGSITSTSTGGDWNSTATWVGGVIPGTNSHVIIATTGGNKVNLNVTATIRTLTINSGAVLEGIATATLSCLDLTNNGTITANAVTLRLANNSQWAGSGTFSLYNIDLNGKTLTLAFAGANTINLSASGDPFLNPGALSPGVTSTIEYNGTSAQSVTSSATINFNNLKISNAAGVTLQKNLTNTNVAGDLTITSGGVLNTSNGTTAFSITGASGRTLTIGANSSLVLGSTATTATAFPGGFSTFTFDPASTVQYDNISSATQTVSATPTYGNLLFTGGGTKSLGSATISLAGNWTNNSTGGSLSIGTSTVVMTGTSKSIAGSASTSFATLTIDGTVTNTVATTVGSALGGSGTLSQGASSTLNLNFGGALTLSSLDASAAGNTVDYQFAGAQTIKSASYANLTLSGSGLKTFASGTTAVAEVFTLSGVTTDATTNSSTIEYNGTGAQTVRAINYHSLTLSGTRTTNSITLESTGTIGIAGAFTPGATFSSGSYVVTSTTMDFNGGTQDLPPFNGATGYNNLILSGASSTKTATGNIVVAGTFDNGGASNNAVTLILGTNTLTYASLENSGATLRFAGATNGIAVSTGTVEYDGTTVAQTIASGTYNNLTLTGSAAKSAANDVTVNGAFSNSSTTSMGTYILTLNGSMTNSGGTMQFAGETNGLAFSDGTVEYNGTVSQTITAGGYATLLLSNSGAKAISSVITVSSYMQVGAPTNLTIDPTGSVTVTGNFDNDGTITNNGTIIVN